MQIPFPEDLPVNSDTILQFCADFLSGKLKYDVHAFCFVLFLTTNFLRNAFDAKEMAKKALQASKLNTRNKAKRSEIKPAPEKVVGVAEPFGDGEGARLVSDNIFDQVSVVIFISCRR